MTSPDETGRSDGGEESRAALQAEIDHEAEAAREQYRERLAFDPLNADSAWLAQKRERAVDSLALDGAGNVLDFGSASCEMSEILAELGPVTVAGDICLDMLAISRQRVRRLGRKAPRWVVFDGRRLPFRDDCFDRAICWNVLHHFLEPEGPAGEIHRVLGGGGRALFMEPLSSNPFRRLFEARFRRQHSGIETSFRRKDLMGQLQGLGFRIEDTAFHGDLVPDWTLEARGFVYRTVTRVRILLSRFAPRAFGSISLLGVKPAPTAQGSRGDG